MSKSNTLKHRHTNTRRNQAGASNSVSKKSGALAVVKGEPITLEHPDSMPTGPTHHVALGDMSVAQLGAMSGMLEGMQEKCDSMSGICATLHGLVLNEVKKKLPRGEYTQWINQRLGKSRKTAFLYVSVANAFLKCYPRVTLEQMTLALMDAERDFGGQTLDITHPTVSAVSKWTKGRSFYQLRKEELTQGGNHHPKCPQCEGDLKSSYQEVCPHCGKATGK